MVYWTQVTTNMSMWCWVLMSAMRYTAIYHPFLHLRVWLLPRRGVQLIVLFSLLLNVCFIGAVEAKNMRCVAVRHSFHGSIRLFCRSACYMTVGQVLFSNKINRSVSYEG
jgi:hypothetical protein